MTVTSQADRPGRDGPVGLDRRPIVLTGFMGAGKTSIGRLLAAELGRPFVDTDEESERIAGRSIVECFRAGDEAGFRDAEAEAVRRAVAEDGAVIALGGGALLRTETRELLLARTLVVYLDVPWSELEPAIPRLVATRPLLQGSSLEDVRRLFESRQDTYRQAHLHVAVARRLPEAADRVIAAVREAVEAG